MRTQILPVHVRKWTHGVLVGHPGWNVSHKQVNTGGMLLDIPPVWNIYPKQVGKYGYAVGHPVWNISPKQVNTGMLLDILSGMSFSNWTPDYSVELTKSLLYEV